MDRRIVETKFVNDEYVLDLEPDEKLTFLYVLLQANRIGIYKIPPKLLAFQTGITSQRMKEILSRFDADGKILSREGYLIIANHHKYYAIDNPSMAIPAIKELTSLPENLVKQIPQIINKIHHTLSRHRTCILPWSLDTVSTQCPHPADTVSTQSEHSHSHSHNHSHSLATDKSVPLTPTDDGDSQRSEGKELSKKRNGEGLLEIDGIFLTEKEQKQFIQKYGEEMFIELPGRVAQWALEKNMEIKDDFKILCKFAEKEIKHGKTK